MTTIMGLCVQASAFGAAPVVWEVTATPNPSPLAAHIPAGLAPIRQPRSEPLSAFTRVKAEPAAAARGTTAAAGMFSTGSDAVMTALSSALVMLCFNAVGLLLHLWLLL